MNSETAALVGDHNTYYKIKSTETRYLLLYRGHEGWITFGNDAERAAGILELECDRLELTMTAPSYLQIAEEDLNAVISKLLSHGAHVALAERVVDEWA